MDSPSRDSASRQVLVFEEDLGGVLRRAYPRAVVSSSAFLGVMWAVIVVVGHDDPDFDLRAITWMFVAIGVVAALRFDLAWLQWRAPRRIEISDTELRAFQGDKEKVRFELEDVADWSVPWPTRVGEFWIEWFTRPTRSLGTFDFALEWDRPWGPRTEVTTPSMLRWADRGGYDDIVAALTERIGKPWNRS